MEELDALREKLQTKRPVDWNDLPDIELYMDQVITYMPRQQVAPGADEGLTPSMINNYIKEGLLARAKGKKYSRDHLAHLTAICLLKYVLSVKDTGLLIKQEIGEGGLREFYGKYTDVLDRCLTEAARLLPGDETLEALSDAALRFALASYANKLACERLLDILRCKTASEPEQKGAKQRMDRGE